MRKLMIVRERLVILQAQAFEDGDVGLFLLFAAEISTFPPAEI